MRNVTRRLCNFDAISTYVFPCGQADCILLEFSESSSGETRWVLVDGGLRDKSSREAFFRFVDRRGILSLDAIILTHPDADHFYALPEIIEYFIQPGRSVGTVFDHGIDPKTVKHVFLPGEKTRLSQLKHLLAVGVQDKLLDWRIVDTSVPLINFFGGWVRFLFPEQSFLLSHAMKSASQFTSLAEIRINSNTASVVLGIYAKGETSLQLILAGDCDDRGALESVNEWNENVGTVGNRLVHTVVKIPHHGSINSGWKGFLDIGAPNFHSNTAILTCGEHRCIPDQKVLESLLRNNWAVFATTTRYGNSQASRRHLIKLTWHALRTEGALEVEPMNAKIQKSDLVFFGTKSS